MEKSTAIINWKIKIIQEIKNILCYENYLELPFYLRNPLTKLRISNHSLQVETERFNLPPLPIDQRKCFFCENFIEDELHSCLIVTATIILKNIKI